jgi:sugar (pentulose or hexulose) kinase
VQTIADVCQRDVLIFTGQETVTRVLFALCMESLGQQKFEDVLVASFDRPEIVPCKRDMKETYDKGYRAYRELSRFAAEQAVKY